MALDKAFFDSISIDVAKKKYYNVNKVQSVLQSIRTEAEALTGENARLRQEVERMNAEKISVSDAIISARELARQIISEASAQADETMRSADARAEEIVREAQEKAESGNREAEKLLEDARAQAEKMLREAEEQRDRIAAEKQEQESYAAKYVLDTFELLKQRQLEVVKQLNEDYQNFLCGLYPEEEDRAAEAAAAPGEEPAEWTAPAKEPDEWTAPAKEPDEEILPVKEPDEPIPPEKEAGPEAAWYEGEDHDDEDDEDDEKEDEASAFENMETVPADLRDKVSAIAKVLRALDGDGKK